MSHKRKEIRAAIAAVLPSALPGFTYRKFAYRPGDVAALPVYEIATPRTEVEAEAVDDETQEVRIEITLRMKGNEDVFDLLDDLGQAVETATLAALKPITSRPGLLRVETAPAPDAAEPIGLMLLTFTARAYVARGNPI